MEDAEPIEIRELPDKTLNEIISIYSNFINRDIPYKSERCLDIVFNRTNFLPESLQKQIDDHNDSLSQKDYLFAHMEFEIAFRRYMR